MWVRRFNERAPRACLVYRSDAGHPLGLRSCARSMTMNWPGTRRVRSGS